MQASEVYILYDLCVYPHSPAFALGIVAAVFTIITRVYISVSFGGGGCCRSDPNSTPVSKLLFVLSWYALNIDLQLFNEKMINSRDFYKNNHRNADENSSSTFSSFCPR